MRRGSNSGSRSWPKPTLSSTAVRKEMSLAERLHEDQGGHPLQSVALGVDALDTDALQEQVVAGLAPGFDPEWGGFGPAPKFPRPSLVELCLRRARRGGSDAGQARSMALRTLDAMAAGGIYDHLVGGFCRYSTDARWLVPHFEKMLTDQALLARAYLHAWQETGHADYLGVVNETLDFVLRDLSTTDGGLYSSFDADAGGVEGAHATFTLGDLEAALPPELRQAAAEWYGISERGNWEGRSIRCVLSAPRSPGPTTSRRLGLSWRLFEPAGCSRLVTRRC